MCWQSIKIDSFSTKGWKVKSNMEGMPNDLEKEKDPTALVETHEAPMTRDTWNVLIDRPWMPLSAKPLAAPSTSTSEQKPELTAQRVG